MVCEVHAPRSRHTRRAKLGRARRLPRASQGNRAHRSRLPKWRLPASPAIPGGGECGRRSGACLRHLQYRGRGVRLRGSRVQVGGWPRSPSTPHAEITAASGYREGRGWVMRGAA
eukprot:scaffold11182_cov122-Isochrysis_galbana.AAC.1